MQTFSGEVLLKGPAGTKLRPFEQLETFFRSLKEAAICVDDDQCILALSSAAEAMFGYSSAEVLGRSFKVLLSPADRAAFDAAGALAKDSKKVPNFAGSGHGEAQADHFLEAPGGAELRVVECQRADGSRFHAETTLSAMFIIGQMVTVVLRDVTEQHRAARNNALLASVASSAPEAIISIGGDGLIATWNCAAERVLGYSHKEIIGQDAALLEFFDASGPLKFWLDGGPLISREAEAQLKRKDGEVISVVISVSPVQSSKLEFVGVCAVIKDCTEAIRPKKLDEYFLREICHRAKNNLAIISAIVRETAARCSTVESFETKLSSRIASLGYAYDALVKLNWRGADLRSLVECQLQPFGASKARQCHISGSPVIMDAQVVQILGLALHELASNARLYGALSSPDGRVDINWRLMSSGASLPSVALSWIETDGPPVVLRQERGFGRFVLERLMNAAFEAEVHFALEPGGVRWEIVIPGKFTDYVKIF
jgi:PAS domain S-box-containing protein